MKQFWEALQVAVPVLVATGLLMLARAGASTDAYLFLVGVVVFATMTLMIVRWLNRRDDPRDAKRPPDAP